MTKGFSFLIVFLLALTAVSAHHSGYYSYGPQYPDYYPQYAQYSSSLPYQYASPCYSESCQVFDGRELDVSKLPVINVFDPDKRENVQITKYSFNQLTEIMGLSGFAKWNDVDKVCQTMEILYGRTNGYCGASTPGATVLAVTPVAFAPRAATARAYVRFTLLPPQQQSQYSYHIEDNRPVVYVDPVYPPWSPTYNPYW